MVSRGEVLQTELIPQKLTHTCVKLDESCLPGSWVSPLITEMGQYVLYLVLCCRCHAAPMQYSLHNYVFLTDDQLNLFLSSPSLSFETVSCFVCGGGRVAVIRHGMICLVIDLQKEYVKYQTLTKYSSFRFNNILYSISFTQNITSSYRGCIICLQEDFLKSFQGSRMLWH